MTETPRPNPALILLATLVATLVITGCAASGPGDDAPSSADPSTRPVRSESPGEPVPSAPDGGVVGEVPADLLERIVADAAGLTGVAPSEIRVVRAESVTWSDGSLGCPEPGMLYTQALVPGYHVVVGTDDAELDYRATESGSFSLCDNPDPPAGG